MKRATASRSLLCGLSFSLVLWLSACRSTPTRIAAELVPLQGHWEGKGAGGKCAINITGNSLHYHAGTNWWKTTFTLPAGTDPQQLYATIKESSPPANGVGTVVFAICEIKDGMLWLAVDDGSDKPPKSFTNASSRYTFTKVRVQIGMGEASTPNGTGKP